MGIGWVRTGAAVAILPALLALFVITGAAQQRQGGGGQGPRAGGPGPASQEPPKKFPYPAIRNQAGAVPPGPKVDPYNDPPLADGPWAMETTSSATSRSRSSPAD